MYRNEKQKGLTKVHIKIKNYVQQFLNNTTLHALNFVGNANISIWERILFFICFVTVATIAANFAMNVYERWDTMPVLIGIEAHTTSVRSLPFPAITICNMNQALRSTVSKLPYYSLGYAMTQKICFQDFNYSIYDGLKPASKEDTFTNFIAKNSQSCNNMIIYCSYGMHVSKCSDFFREVLMDEGMCCAFNILHPSYLYKGVYNFVRDYTSSVGTIAVDWNLETGYADNLPQFYYPRLASGDGISMGFSFVLNANLSEYVCSSTFSTGFKIIAHNPIDTPHIKETGLSVMPGYQYRFSLTINHWKATAATRSISWRRRQCFFDNEFQLLYYRYYTRRNCEMECNSQHLLRRCNCIPYHMPPIYSNTSYCHVRDFNCENLAEQQMNDEEHTECKSKCLPSCYNLEYYTDMYSTPLARAKFTLSHDFFRKFPLEFLQENLALVDFYFSDELFRSFVRTPYTSFTDYLSYTGGIMSLMLGFSVISIAEILYFLLIRPIFDFFLRRPMLGAASRNYAPQSLHRSVTVVGQKQLKYRKPLASSRKKMLAQSNYDAQKMFRNCLRAQRSPNSEMVPLYRLGDVPAYGENIFPYTE